MHLAFNESKLYEICVIVTLNQIGGTHMAVTCKLNLNVDCHLTGNMTSPTDPSAIMKCQDIHIMQWPHIDLIKRELFSVIDKFRLNVIQQYKKAY